MPPKKRSKGVASSSSALFDRNRFWNAKAAENYNALVGRPMHRERGWDVSHPGHHLLVEVVRRGWAEFVKPPTDAVVSLVREFYANLKVRHENMAVRVRGRMVAFDSVTINAFHHMPDIEHDEYRAFMQEPVDFVKILRYLCHERAVWKTKDNGEITNFKATFLKNDAMSWFLLITSRIMPSGHVSDVTKDRAALIYCIMQGKSVDLGKIVHASILHASRGSSDIDMPHSSLISDLCQYVGITWDDSAEELLKVRAPIDIYYSRPTRRAGARAERDSSSDDDTNPARTTAQPLPPPPQPQSRSLDERLAALELRVDAHCQRTDTFMSYMTDFTVALAQRFPGGGPDFMPFPQPPTWPPQDPQAAMDEDDDDDH